MKSGVIILAAGASVRFGTDKRLAQLQGKPLLLRSLECYAHLNCPKVVVTSEDLPMDISNRLEPLADIVRLPYSDSAMTPKGIGASLAEGIKFALARKWDAALVGLGDMPCIKRETIDAIFQRLCNHNNVVPVYESRRGHPVGFQKAWFNQLALLTGDAGGRAILDQSKPIEIKVQDPGIVLDVDYPDQLNQVLEYIEQ